MTIKILSNSTINKISAGEVIERPASVVKELVENAIDAGANKIEIILECAGKNLIIIKDNGIGMNKAELELAIQRHATSKLDEDDLLNINSFGFRGEALPSIGAISKFTITSKKQNEKIAHSLTIIGGQVQPTLEATRNTGATIEVRDLFFATPARLKFLRADRTELNASIQIIKRIAIAHPDIEFALIHNDKQLIKVKPKPNINKENIQNIENRISEIINPEFITNSTKVSLVRSGIEIYGYTSLPTHNRASAEDQFLFINNRPVKDKLLNIALKVAYQDYLARDRHPISVLFIKVDPQFVDVNVHPAKTEVRFHDPNLIRNLVISSIKDALNNSSNRVSTDPSVAAMNYIQANQSNINTKLREQNNSKPQSAFQIPLTKNNNNLGNNTQSKSFSNYVLPSTVKHSDGEIDNNYLASSSESKANYSELRPDYALMNDAKMNDAKDEGDKPHAIIEEERGVNTEQLSKFPLGAAKAQLHSTYIISQTNDSIIITDQHAAHERIGYEKIKQQIEKNGLIKQRLLIPEIIELPDTERANILNDNKSSLSELGLTIEKFGDKSIIVSEMPSLVGDVNCSQIILDLADYFMEFGENIVLTELIEHITETYACHYAIRAGKKLKAEEMNELLRQMENTPFSGQCNHGRQTYIELKLKDIEKLFGRK